MLNLNLGLTISGGESLKITYRWMANFRAINKLGRTCVLTSKKVLARGLTLIMSENSKDALRIQIMRRMSCMENANSDTKMEI